MLNDFNYCFLLPSFGWAQLYFGLAQTSIYAFGSDSRFGSTHCICDESLWVLHAT